MTKPTMVLLDEPSMGLSPALVDIVFEAIAAIHAAAPPSCSWSRTHPGRSPSATTPT